MSKKILFGVIDTIELLLLLPDHKFITSGLIRKQFLEMKYDTIYKKLKTLLKQGFVQERSKKGEFAGDDRTEYKLTPSGVVLRKELINKMLKLLDPIIKKMAEEEGEAVEISTIPDKQEQIEDFLMDFLGESEELVDHTVMKQLQKILSRLLDKTF